MTRHSSSPSSRDRAEEAIDLDAFHGSLPVIDYMPLLGDTPPYSEILGNELSYWPAINAVLVGQYSLVRQVLSDPSTFSSAASIPSLTRGKPAPVEQELARALPEWVLPESTMVINAVGRGHLRQRTIFAQGFTRQAIHLRTPLIEAAAANYAEALRPTGRGDLIGTYIRPLLDDVINTIYGYTAQDTDRVHRYCDAVNDLLQPTIDNPAQVESQIWAARTLGDAVAHLDHLFAARAAKRPERERDLLYHLVHGRGGPSGYRLTRRERIWNALVSRVAAEETTRYLIASTIVVMLELGLWEQARTLGEAGRHRLISRCIEETARARSPHTGLMRITTRRTRLGTHTIPAGTMIVFSLAAANLDPSVFPNPRQIDLTRRRGSGHLAFGHGPRKCPARHLARLEALIAIDTLVPQLPKLRRPHPNEPVPQVPHLFFAGPERLDVVWDT